MSRAFPRGPDFLELRDEEEPATRIKGTSEIRFFFLTLKFMYTSLLLVSVAHRERGTFALLMPLRCQPRANTAWRFNVSEKRWRKPVTYSAWMGL